MELNMESNMEYSIKKAEENDWEDAMALAYRTFRKYVADGYTEEGVNNFLDFISDTQLYRMFILDEYHLWVAIDSQGNTIGMASLRSGNHISLLFVDEKWHRKGVGSALMDTMVEYVKKGHYESITVNASPYGIPFYHDLGFVDEGEEVLNGGMYITPMRKRV